MFSSFRNGWMRQLQVAVLYKPQRVAQSELLRNPEQFVIGFLTTTAMGDDQHSLFDIFSHGFTLKGPSSQEGTNRTRVTRMEA